MKVKALKRFYDRKEQKLRLPNDVFEATKDRADELIASPYGAMAEIVKEVKSDNEKPKKKPNKK